MNKKIVKIEFHSFWHIGTGRGTGVGVDSLQFVDVDNLPVWPGKSLKGVFRDAFAKAVELDSLPHTDEELKVLFGPAVQSNVDEVSTNGTVQIRFQKEVGAFRFSDACMATSERMPVVSAWARDKKNKKMVEFLYTDVANIRLNEQGITEDGSLRIIRLTKPLTLFAEIEFVDNNMTMQDPMTKERAFDRLERMFPLIRLAGASRTRGLGRLTVQFHS